MTFLLFDFGHSLAAEPRNTVCGKNKGIFRIFILLLVASSVIRDSRLCL